MVIVLRILGMIVFIAALAYGIAALMNVSYLADPELESKYPTLLAQYTASRDYDAALSMLAFVSSGLIFGFASMLAKVWQIEDHLRSRS